MVATGAFQPCLLSTLGSTWAQRTDGEPEVVAMLAYIRKVTERQDEGASAVEYGLLVAAIAALVVLVVFALGGYVKGAFDKTCSEIRKNAQGVQSTTTQ